MPYDTYIPFLDTYGMYKGGDILYSKFFTIQIISILFQSATVTLHSLMETNKQNSRVVSNSSITIIIVSATMQHGDHTMAVLGIGPPVS